MSPTDGLRIAIRSAAREAREHMQAIEASLSRGADVGSPTVTRKIATIRARLDELETLARAEAA